MSSADTFDTLPNHIGIIMDGNRRWARKRLLPVQMGHKKGAEIMKDRLYDLSAMKVKNVTYYTLSTENFNREKDEIDGLMRLFEQQLDGLEKIVNRDNIRLLFIGDLSVFPESMRNKIAQAESGSADNTGLTCRIALNYGGRAEIVRAAGQLALSDEVINEKSFGEKLYTGNAPDVDLIIRTGGEKRLSNFLLWQAAYAELYFVDTLWCDFGKPELEKALTDFASRNRRFGK